MSGVPDSMTISFERAPIPIVSQSQDKLLDLPVREFLIFAPGPCANNKRSAISPQS
jgi:hypothetical protein